MINETQLVRFARGFAWLAGLGDLLTGFGLIGLPAFTLRAMGVAVPADEALIFVRFVGVFVAAVGASYLLALAAKALWRLWSVFRMTLLFRIGAGAFVAWGVMTGQLERAWISVTLVDGFVAVVQIWLLGREPNG